jgi:hypothetical protein
MYKVSEEMKMRFEYQYFTNELPLAVFKTSATVNEIFIAHFNPSSYPFTTYFDRFTIF